MGTPRTTGATPSAGSVAVTAFVGLGSNQGDRLGFLRRALRELGENHAIELCLPASAASVYETSPVEVNDTQPPYFNTVVRIRVGLPPRELLSVLQGIEIDLGRRRTIPRGQRTIDLDLLLYGAIVLSADGITIPHPRLCRRRFVLEPLAEIAADVAHPILDVSIGTLADRARSRHASDSVSLAHGRDWCRTILTTQRGRRHRHGELAERANLRRQP